MTKIKDYAIIDHIGSLEDENTVKKAYRLAYGLIPKGRKAYTIKQVCQLYNPRVTNLKSMKNAMRMQRRPEQIVLITSDMYSADHKRGRTGCGQENLNCCGECRPGSVQHMVAPLVL